MAVLRSPLVHKLTVLAAPAMFCLLAFISIWKQPDDES
jgi:hypothetical protein